MSRAIFEGALSTDRKTVLARGPFEVEVYTVSVRNSPRWCARLKPTNAAMREGSRVMQRKTETEAQVFVEFNFQKKVRGWE